MRYVTDNFSVEESFFCGNWKRKMKVIQHTTCRENIEQKENHNGKKF